MRQKRLSLPHLDYPQKCVNLKSTLASYGTRISGSQKGEPSRGDGLVKMPLMFFPLLFIGKNRAYLCGRCLLRSPLFAIASALNQIHKSGDTGCGASWTAIH